MPKVLAQNDFSQIPVKGLVAESGPTAPANPVGGQLWYDTSTSKLKVWQGSWITLDVDTNTTYLAGSQAEVNAGADGTNKVWSPSTLKAAITGLQAVTAVAGKTGNVSLAISDIASLTTTLAGKSDNGHTHDDRYYTETEIDQRLTAVTIPAATDTTQGKVELATPAEVVAGTDTTRAATPAGVAAAVAALVASAPGTLDTLKELATALNNDPNFATTIANQIAGKANVSHTHSIAEVNGLTAALNAKPTLVSGSVPALTAGNWTALPGLNASTGIATGIEIFETATNEQVVLDTRSTATEYQVRSGAQVAGSTLRFQAIVSTGV